MPELIAQGPQLNDRWRKKLPSDTPIILGRNRSPWSIPWDKKISGEHAEIVLKDGRISLRRLQGASNPVFLQGKAQDTFTLGPGEHFVIGGTTFTYSTEQADVSQATPYPWAERTFSRVDLGRVQFRDADKRIEALARLPDLISFSANDDELFEELVQLLLLGIPIAASAAVIGVDPLAQSADSMKILKWDRRIYSSSPYQISDRLVRKARETGQTVVHIWNPIAATNDAATLAQSEAAERGWAICCPIPGEDGSGWVLYIAGAFDSGSTPSDSQLDPNALREDLRFAEIVSSTIGNLRKIKQLEHSQSALRQFLSPVVLEALRGQDPERVLSPREADVAVLFCDLRGFSKKSELGAEALLELLRRVSRALGVMTHCILETGGVIGDFHGDAAMGFWGWPLTQPDAPLRACRAAMAIRMTFEAASKGDPSASRTLREEHFGIGIGIAMGKAVAGQIGTTDQVKVTVFGPVVNLASRLEGMTKALQAPIIVDEAVAEFVRNANCSDEFRIRRIARVRPFGLATPLLVSELLPPTSRSPLRDEDIQFYEAALEDLRKGQWEKAFRQLYKVTAEDLVKDFLTVYIAQHNRTPPAGWDGVIGLASK
jgi:adenylate cyclase